jgi:predicted cupin superfamily sugar epimerase
MPLTASEIIRLLGLKPHPEGGHFVETHRDAHANGRAHATAIYFLLAQGERSHWHKVDATEVWHYYAGSALALEIAATSHGPIERIMLGPDLAGGERPQAVVGCTVAPGFEFAGFELAPKGWAPGGKQ